MKHSKFNIISRINDSDNYFIVNVLSQNADILAYSEIQSLLKKSEISSDNFIEKGYIVDSQIEEKIYKSKYLEFIDNRETDEVQLFYVPSYACNFSCSYCYQDEYDNKEQTFDEQVINAFFQYIDSRFSNRKKYITIFGGEPLRNSQKQKLFFEYFISLCNERKLELAIVTNGYHLKNYIDILKKASIREIQVTLDGTAEFHNKRRMLKGGIATFNEIVVGIDASLAYEMPINLRMVIDKENIENLPDIAQFTIDKGWTNSKYFKTQLGRNYELHHCQSASSLLYSRIEMYKDIFNLLKKYPHIEKFHKPAFSISKFLFEEGRLPDPLFDSCPGTKTEWAFDYTGKIYSCTATVGKPGEELGTFYPEIKLNENTIGEWQNRDVLSIEKCKSCEVQLICGGGCASVAKNNTGTINAPDCRPVKELMELGIAYYFER